MCKTTAFTEINQCAKPQAKLSTKPAKMCKFPLFCVQNPKLDPPVETFSHIFPQISTQAFTQFFHKINRTI